MQSKEKTGGESKTDKPLTLRPPTTKEVSKGGVTPGTKATPVVHKEAYKALNSGISDAIIDIRVSITEQQEADLSRNGYVQLLQEDLKHSKKVTNTTGGSTFGNRASLWTWSRGQGTCSGRLKPIIDVQLEMSSSSSDLVLSGYICDPVPIAGQWLWVKRAISEEEEKDAIVDLFVTTGKMKDTTDPVWSSPGVGWIRVDGNFSKSMFSSIDSILWFRPARTRSLDSHMTSPIRSTVALTEDVRNTKLMSAIRLALRHYVPVQDVKRLANLVMETSIAGSVASPTNANIVRSERMADFVNIFHEYQIKGKMPLSKLTKMLYDLGVRLNKTDILHCFNHFDANHNGFISIEEYSKTLSLTDYELDLAVEKIRVKLLSTSSSANSTAGAFTKAANKLAAGVSKPCIGVLGAGSIVPHVNVGRNKIRENLTMLQVFKMINVKCDAILSLDEVMDLASKMEVFLTEEEARKVLLMMDVDGDDRVEEADFIQFMRKESSATVKKAYRVREAAAMLRRWLVRGNADKGGETATATASKKQWSDFKKRYEKATNLKFPGYLSAPVLLSTFAILGVRLSAIEARELTLLMSPEKNGRIHQSDLHSFMSRNCRSFGELVAVLERDILKDLFDAFRAHNSAIKALGKEDPDLADNYRKKLDKIKQGVEIVFSKPPPVDESKDPRDDDGRDTVPAPAPVPEPKFRKSSHEVISFAQLKAGIEDVFKENEISESLFPNLEEWAALSVLVDADIAEGDIYGVKLKALLEGLCAYAVLAADEAKIRAGEKVSLDVVSKDLKRQIYMEARAGGKAKKPDYKTVFELFDLDKNGSIGLDELKHMLLRLQLVNVLPDYQIPNLLTMFDRNKSGMVTMDEFVAFAEDYVKVAGGAIDDMGNEVGTGLDNDLDDDDDLNEDDEDFESMSSSVPPVQVTKNADCDWLLWFLYKQSCKAEPTDPESVITDLEASCSETEMIIRNQSSISVKEFWNLLFEKRLQGAMSKSQYIKGIQIVCSEGSGRDDDRVNYEVLCRNIIRMGRGYNQELQARDKMDEGKFFPLLAELKKYFQDLTEEKSADKTDRHNGLTRYEKIFRRLDSDGDGMMTMREFKIGLRKLHYEDEKAWSIRMIRRLFDMCDKNRDGLLSIKEFKEYILERDDGGGTKYELASRLDNKMKNGTPMSKIKQQEGGLNLSDDEEDEVFRKHKTLTDHELIRKVNEVLHDIVPVEENTRVKHTETVRNSVRRFFVRADPEHKGVVSEERFRAFLRRSTLQDRLTASELRRLTEKLKRKASGGVDRSELNINYEKLIQLLNVAVESIPKSKAETIFTRFQEAAIASSGTGRPFLSLCSLVDLRLSGKITKEELIVTAKMMDFPMTYYDVDAMLEMFPSSVLSKDNLVDYRMIQNMIQTYEPRMNTVPDLDPRLSKGALPAYASPHMTLRNLQDNEQNAGKWMNKSINSPLGHTITTPFRAYDDMLSNRPGGILQNNASGNLIPGRASRTFLGGGSNDYDSSNVYERTLRLIVDRIKLAVEERSRHYGHSFSIRQQFEIYDNDTSGLVHTRTLQVILEDIGVILSAADLQSVYHLYGRPEDDKVYYEPLCRAVESAGQVDLYRRSQSTPGTLSGTGFTAQDAVAPYLNERVLQRLRELKADRRSPRDIFEVSDLDRNGMISSLKFKEVVVKLQLLQTEHQLVKAMEDFSSIQNRSYIMYEDFCAALDKALATADNVKNRSQRGGVVDGGGYDGMRSSNYGTSMFGNDNDEPLNVYDSMANFRSQVASTPSRNVLNNYPNDLDEGSDIAYDSRGGYPLSPPKVFDSINLSRSHRGIGGISGIAASPRGAGGRYSSPVRGYRSVSYNDDSPRRSTSSIQAPRTSPSKVGSKMWGSHTPLAKKGNALSVGHGKWCCAVCLYVENSDRNNKCAVCESPNYNSNPDYQVKEQCVNCTYMNGQFAEECEMCGEPLSAAGHSRKNVGSSSMRKEHPESSFKIRDSRYNSRGMDSPYY